MIEGPLGFALYALPPLLVAVILHEIAHGYVAYRLGDPTAKKLGRLSLNPLVHIDPFLTIIVPGILILSGSPIIFGGAKPVPINPMNFRNPRKDMVLVAIAGPLTNLILMGICLGLLQILSATQLFVLMLSPALANLLVLWLVYGVMINIVLALFNLLPVPPLDGGRIAVGLLPLPLALALAKLERFGILIVFLLLYAGLFDFLIKPALKSVLQFMPIAN